MRAQQNVLSSSLNPCLEILSFPPLSTGWDCLKKLCRNTWLMYRATCSRRCCAVGNRSGRYDPRGFTSKKATIYGIMQFKVKMVTRSQLFVTQVYVAVRLHLAIICTIWAKAFERNMNYFQRYSPCYSFSRRKIQQIYFQTHTPQTGNCLRSLHCQKYCIYKVNK